MKHLIRVGAALAIFVLAHNDAFAMASLTEGKGAEKQHAFKGVNRDRLYFATGGADVDPFSFNMVVGFSEPLGFPTQVDGGLSLALTRVYNSQVYTERSWQCGTSCAAGGGASSSLVYLSMPRENPMGLGWEFHLGKIYLKDSVDGDPPSVCGDLPTTHPGKYAFVSPDGAEHLLYKEPSGWTYHTRDGSMIRAERFQAFQAGDKWEVYLPAGRILELAHHVEGVPYKEDDGVTWCNSVNGATGDYFIPDEDLTIGDHDRDKIGWHTSRIRNREMIGSEPAAWIKVDYQDPPFDYIMKTVYDSHHGPSADRSVDVVIDTDPSSDEYGLIKTVHFPSPPLIDGTPRQKLALRFEYVTRDIRIQIHNQDIPSGEDPPAPDEIIYHPVKQLESVIADTPGVPRYGFRYSYRISPETRVIRNKSTSGHDWGGQLEEIQYPSGKVAGFDYGMHSRKTRDIHITDQQNPNCNMSTKAKPSTSKFVGVTMKKEYLTGDTANEDSDYREWTFVTTEFGVNSGEYEEVLDEDVPGVAACQLGIEYFNSISRMVDPAGNWTEVVYDTSSHYTWNNDRHWKGPPDHPLFGTELKVRNYAGDDTGELVRTTEKTWDVQWHDPEYGVSWTTQSQEKIIYLDDRDAAGSALAEPTALQIDYENWAGGVTYGHYETKRVSGNAIGNWENITRTDYAIDNSNCGSSGTAGLEAAWLPNAVTSTTVSVKESGQSEVLEAVTEFAFDTNTGRVTGRVSRANPQAITIDPCSATIALINPGPDDHVTESVYDPYGNLEKSLVRLGNGAPFATEYRYSYGALSKSFNPELSFVEMSAAIDATTSLPLEQIYGRKDEDPDNTKAIVKSIEYDALRRTKSEEISGTEPWTIVYDDEQLDTDSARDRMVRIRTQRGSGDQFQETVEHYDKAGRVFKSEKLNPDGTRSYKHTKYDQAGRVGFVSEWTTATTCNDCAGATTIYSYEREPTVWVDDAFGRPRRVIGTLDGEETTYDYFGTNKSVTVAGIAVAGVGDAFDLHTRDSTTTYYTDGLGRLRAVVAPDTGGGDVATSNAADAAYDYDYAGRLTKAALADDMALSPQPNDRYFATVTNAQERTYRYDALGRQTESTDPESGTTRIWEWNALGAPVKVQDALGTERGHHHWTTYDLAGRLRKTERVLDDAGDALSLVYTAGLSTAWTSSGFDLTDSQQEADCTSGETAWYIGDGDCGYAATGAPQISTLTLDSPIQVPSAGAQLSFRYLREVRENPTTKTLHLDRLKVRVTTNTTNPDWDNEAEVDELLYLDSKQLSWSRWKRSPAISLDAYAGQQILIQFHFDPFFPNTTQNERGVAISEIAIERPEREVLSETIYDEDFGIATNRSRGQATTIKSFDESSHEALFTKQFVYDDSVARLTRESVIADWDRDGHSDAFEAAYTYNAMGQLASQVLPHLLGEIPARTIEYTYSRGGVVGIYSDDGTAVTDIVPYSPSTPGIAYNLAGGIETLRYGNGLRGEFAVNEAFLPSRIKVEPAAGGGSPLFDTGAYSYDGTRNIKAIGNDVYRYDLAGRLRRAKVTSTDFPSGLYVDYNYDIYGNMRDRQTGVSASAIGGEGPWGLHFANRGYADDDNTISDTGYHYDANGNLIEEPSHESVGGYRYAFSPENQLRLVRSVESAGAMAARVLQESHYDPGGNRWARMISEDGGKALLTLRDATGQVAAEYVESNDTQGPLLSKQYVHGNGRLIAVHADCGPAPELKVIEVTATTLVLEKFDHIPSSEGYSVFIETESGAVTEIAQPASLPDQFSLDWSEFSATENNWVRIQTHAECGGTGYSNAVSFSRKSLFGCIEATALANKDFTIGRGYPFATLQLRAYHTCMPGFKYKALYTPAGGGTEIEVATSLDEPEVDLPFTGLSAGYGTYSFVDYDPATGNQSMFYPQAIKDHRNAATGSNQLPGYSSIKTEYVHWDHLGSTRLVTDEMGLAVASHKYYPFGHEAEIAGNDQLRMKFTGHERDSELQLDYMLARYYGSNLGRFLSVDPLASSGRPQLPQSWNRYAYVLNNPIGLVDPLGLIEEEKKGLGFVEGSSDSTSAEGKAGLAETTVEGSAGTIEMGAAIIEGEAHSSFTSQGVDLGSSGSAKLLGADAKTSLLDGAVDLGGSVEGFSASAETGATLTMTRIAGNVGVEGALTRGDLQGSINLFGRKFGLTLIGGVGGAAGGHFQLGKANPKGKGKMGRKLFGGGFKIGFPLFGGISGSIE